MTQISDVSIMLFPWGVTPPTVSEIVDAAKLAEDLGFYSVTLPTHMTLPPGWLFEDFPNRHVLDALVVVPAIAAATSTIRIGFNSLLPPLLPRMSGPSISPLWMSCRTAGSSLVLRWGGGRRTSRPLE